MLLLLILFSALGSEPLSAAQSSLTGILFALGSNMCFAFRNVGTKYFSSGGGEKTKTTPEGFAAISLSGLLALVPAWLLLLTIGSAPPRPTFLVITSALAHTVYNLLSLTVILALFDPLQHAVLNTGKRASIVLAFYLAAQRPFRAVT